VLDIDKQSFANIAFCDAGDFTLVLISEKSLIQQ
jgi:hypothetical protein